MEGVAWRLLQELADAAADNKGQRKDVHRRSSNRPSEASSVNAYNSAPNTATPMFNQGAIWQ
jgi:hypothetical protein